MFESSQESNVVPRIRQQSSSNYSRIQRPFTRRGRGQDPDLLYNMLRRSREMPELREIQEEAVEESEKSSLSDQSVSEDLSNYSNAHPDSDFSLANEFYYDLQEQIQSDSMQQLSYLAQQRLKEDKVFAKHVLATWGTIGLEVWQRSRRLNFDRKNLLGQSLATMSKFSSGMSLRDIENIIARSIRESFRIQCKESYKCLKMVDKMLPQDLQQLLCFAFK